jgi:hypothetical protein
VIYRDNIVVIVVENPENSRGFALIMALLILCFLTALGGALLAAATIDVWIGDNHAGAIQSLYVAEAGIEEARESLRINDGVPPAADEIRVLTDHAGGVIGHYQASVWNDDGILHLSSLGRVGTARKLIEVKVRKAGFPESRSHPMLRRVTGLERLAAAIAAHANDVYSPEYGEAHVFSGYGSPSDYRIAVVHGDAALETGDGYGILLARGNLTVRGNFNWRGLILIIGQGVFDWTDSSLGMIEGDVFVARTRANDRSPENRLGSLLSEPGETTAFDFAQRDIRRNDGAVTAASRPFPYVPIAVRER